MEGVINNNKMHNNAQNLVILFSGILLKLFKTEISCWHQTGVCRLLGGPTTATDVIFCS